MSGFDLPGFLLLHLLIGFVDQMIQMTCEETKGNVSLQLEMLFKASWNYSSV